MKTKDPVQNNFNPTPDEMAVRRAIHLLQDRCGDDLVLMQNQKRSVYLIPSILPAGVPPTEHNGQDVERPAGTVEYQISDGYTNRSQSIDCYSLDEAIKEFNRIQEHGW